MGTGTSSRRVDAYGRNVGSRVNVFIHTIVGRNGAARAGKEWKSGHGWEVGVRKRARVPGSNKIHVFICIMSL